jgi:hypothetical protein
VNHLRRRGVICPGSLKVGRLIMSGPHDAAEGSYRCDAAEEWILELKHTPTTGLAGTTVDHLAISPSNVGGEDDKKY